MNVTITWEDLMKPQPKPVSHAAVRCLCGRYAKWLGGGHYYNGSFDCYSYTVRCARCGDVTVECV